MDGDEETINLTKIFSIEWLVPPVTMVSDDFFQNQTVLLGDSDRLRRTTSECISIKTIKIE